MDVDADPLTGAPAPVVPVLVAGGGPVGLATAMELARRGVECVVVEPRETVSRARPRCKTVNVRTMEHLRRWGLAAALRARAPLGTDYSQAVVFCTSLAGRELARIDGVLGLTAQGDRFPELGQQAPQYVLEELLRDEVRALPEVTFAIGWRLTALEQSADGVRAVVTGAGGAESVVEAQYVVGCDGARSAVRDAIGAAYVGEHALRPNFGMVFRSPDLWAHVRQAPAVQYWTVNPDAPSLMGPLDGEELWWIIALGVEAEDGLADPERIIRAAVGARIEATVRSSDPWTARMQLVDRAHVGRVLLAGDAAHLNPPFGGHGLNTGIGDAVDLGWKLAGTLAGWGGPGLLRSYEPERRPVQEQVIAAAVANMRSLSGDFVDPALDAPGPDGDHARRVARERIERTKTAEFHALDLVLDVAYASSLVVDSPGPEWAPGARLQHAWLAPGRSLYDDLGPGFTLLVLAGEIATAEPLTVAAATRGVPLRVLDLGPHALAERYGTRYVLVRPDQHVAWRGDRLPDDPQTLIDRVSGHA